MKVDTARPISTTNEFAGDDLDPRSEILDAAALAFMTKGYAATSIDDVADILSATKGKIYHHYRKKADLFFDVHKRGMEMDLAAVHSAAIKTHQNAIDKLRAMTLAHITVIMDHLPYQRVAVQGLEMHLAGETTAAQRDVLSEILVLRDQYETLFREAIQAVMTEGNAPAQDLQIVVKAFFGALNWTTIWYRPRPDQTEEEKLAVADSISTFAVRGLGVQ
jgi:AcrR family transcriptional regulator